MEQRRRRGPGPGESRRYTDANGTEWTFTARPHVRLGEEETHVSLLIESAWETRVVVCPREEWELDEPDFARLLAESLPPGGSRGLSVPESDEPPEPDLPQF